MRDGKTKGQLIEIHQGMDPGPYSRKGCRLSTRTLPDQLWERDYLPAIGARR